VKNYRSPKEQSPMKIQRRLGIASILLGLLSATALATTYYVSNTGSNNNDGRSVSSAWQTIQYAADHLQAGDTVQVLGGTYIETVNIPVSGSATAGYVTFQNYP